MGNQLAKSAARPAELLSDLPNVVWKDTLGGGRLMKTFLCVHDEGGLVVVKVYLKREGSPRLDEHRQRLAHLRDALSGLERPQVWPFQVFFETEQKAFLLRQFVFSNLYERISTRPFLSNPEKVWITYQLLFALAQAHERGVCHGDIKCENVLVTSWNWVHLADFASFKPTMVPADNPADFSFYFDAGGRRRCYLAPERFVDAQNAATSMGAGPRRKSPPPPPPLTPAMDVFSLGCVLGELFLEGKALFDLSQLHAYRRGEFDPTEAIAKIDHPPVEALILHMIQIDPSKRHTASRYLEEWGKDIFPSYISQTLHPFYAQLLPMDSDGRLAALKHKYAELKACFGIAQGKEGSHGVAKPGGATEGRAPGAKAAATPNAGMMTLVSLICSLLRNTRTPSSRCTALNLLCETGLHCENETKLQHVVPYLLGMVNQGPIIVRSVALRALTHILDSVSPFPASEEKLFSEYVFPSLALLCSDPDELVRVQFANEFPKLVANAHRLVGDLSAARERARAEGAKKEGALGEAGGRPGPAAGPKDKHESELHLLRKEISRILLEMTTGPLATRATIQAVLRQFGSFCVLFGPQETNNFLLPLLISFLNHTDWRVRKDFFTELPEVGEYVGTLALEAFLLPCIEQAFLDLDCEVMNVALIRLSEIVKKKMLRKGTVLDLIEKTKQFLTHDSAMIHASVAKLIANAAGVMTETDVYAHVLPRLGEVWGAECPNLRDEKSILESLKALDVARPKGPTGDRSPAVSMVNTQDSRISPGMTVYSVSKTDFMRTPEQSVHSAVRTGSFQHKEWKKAFQTEHPHNHPGAISLLDQSSLFVSAVKEQRPLHESFVNIDAQRNLSDAVVDALSTGVSANANPRAFNTQTHHAWRPRGVLISHLAEHRRAVNKMCVSSDTAFFASASDDGTVKVWDVRKLEKDISFKSRLTYSSQGGRILSCVSMGSTIISASSNGSIHFWDVEYVTRAGVAEKYTGIQALDHAAPAEGAILALAVCGDLVLYATQQGVIHAHDQRQSADAWRLECKQALGVVGHMTVDPHKNAWLATATDSGAISVFDLRFLLCAKQWMHPSQASIGAMVPLGAGPPPGAAAGVGGPDARNCVLIASGEHETGLWNIFEGRCEQVFRSYAGSGKAGGHDAPPVASRKALPIEGDVNILQVEPDVNAVNAYLRAQQLKDPIAEGGAGHRAILPLPSGAFVTAGTDRFLRFWHPTRFEQSYVVCGPRGGQEIQSAKRAPVYYKKQAYNGIPTVEEATAVVGAGEGGAGNAGSGERGAPLKHGFGGGAVCHEDCVLDMALIDPGHEKIVVSCSRDGIIKAWK